MTSIWRYLTVALTAGIALLLAGTGWLVLAATRRALTQQFDEGLATKAQALIAAAEEDDGELELDFDVERLGGFHPADGRDVDTARTGYGHTGLGLSLVRGFCELQGWRVRASLAPPSTSVQKELPDCRARGSAGACGRTHRQAAFPIAERGEAQAPAADAPPGRDAAFGRLYFPSQRSRWSGGRILDRRTGLRLDSSSSCPAHR